MHAAEIVESNEHLLIEILVLLPPRSIFRFMCVSKRWNSIIDDPFFRRSYSDHRRSFSGGGRLLALFQKTRIYPYSFVITNIRPISTTRINYIPGSHVPFVNSSNGLILCCSDHITTFHVVNPVAGKSVSLPPPPPPPPPYQYYHRTSVGLMCMENMSELKANYIVIRAHQHGYFKSVLCIQTYSSITGKWALSRLAATGEFELLSTPPMVANGVFHWFALLPTIVDHEELKSSWYCGLQSQRQRSSEADSSTPRASSAADSSTARGP